MPLKSELIIDPIFGAQAVTKLSNDVSGAVTKGVKKGAKQSKSAFRSIFSGVAIGNLISRGITSAVGAIRQEFSRAFQDVRDFGRGISEINSILPKNAKLTEQSIKSLKSFSGEFASERQTQIKGFYNIVSAGIKGTAKQLDTLRVSNKAAIAGLTDVNDAAKVITQSMNAYGQSGITATQVSDALFVAVREGQTTFSELSGSIGNATGIASAAGVEFSELTGAVAAFTKTGLKTETAVIGIRQALVAVLKPTKEARDEAKKLGIDFTTAGIKAKGLAGFLKDVQVRTGNNSTSLAKLFGNVRALTPILTTLNGNFTEFSRVLDATEKSAGATNTAFEIMQDNLDFQAAQFIQELRNVSTELLGQLAPSLRTVIGLTRDFLGLSRASKIDEFIDVGDDILKIENQLRDLIVAKQEAVDARFQGAFLNSIFGDDPEDIEEDIQSLAKELNELKDTYNNLDLELNGPKKSLLPDGVDDSTPKDEPVIPIKLEEDTETLSDLFSDLGKGFRATQKEIEAGTIKMAKSAAFLGQQIKKGIGQGIGAGFGAFGAALVSGENALDAFAKAFLSTLGTMMIQQGTAFILQGLGFSVIPGMQASGGTLIAAGAGLAALGGALTAIGSGANSAATGAAAGAGGGGSSEGFGTSEFQEDAVRQEQEKRVNLNVEGNFFDTQDSRIALVDLINKSIETDGARFVGGNA